MGLIKCVVPGCEDRCSPRHRIQALDQELYEEWLKRIGNEELKLLDPEFVRTNKRICSVHFSSHCRIPNSTKLKNRSLPTLHLPGFNEEPNEKNSILKYSRTSTKRAEVRRDSGAAQSPKAEASEIKACVATTNVTPSSVLPPSCPLDFTGVATTNVTPSSVLPPSCPLDFTEDTVGESVAIETTNIDFTYLMTITSLPDYPLINDSQETGATSQILSPGQSDARMDDLASSAAVPPASWDETLSNSSLLSSIDLEELVREHWKSLIS